VSPDDLARRERDTLRALRLEAIPQGLPEHHNGASSLGAVQRRIDLFGSLGEDPTLEVVPGVEGPRVEIAVTRQNRRSA
jgi:hypothetical protein